MTASDITQKLVELGFDVSTIPANDCGKATGSDQLCAGGVVLVGFSPELSRDWWGRRTSLMVRAYCNRDNRYLWFQLLQHHGLLGVAWNNA